jgi:hypothetical protein
MIPISVTYVRLSTSLSHLIPRLRSINYTSESQNRLSASVLFKLRLAAYSESGAEVQKSSKRVLDRQQFDWKLRARKTIVSWPVVSVENFSSWRL